MTGFVGWWLAGNTISGVGAAALGLLHPPLLAGLGLLGGLFQWFVLRRVIPLSRRWILASAAGACVGLLLGGALWLELMTTVQFIAVLLPAMLPIGELAGDIFIPVGSAVAGLALGALQAYALGADPSAGRSWALRNAAGFAAASLAFLANLATTALPGASAPGLVGSIPMTLAAGACGGLLFGVITATGLRSFLREGK